MTLLIVDRLIEESVFGSMKLLRTIERGAVLHDFRARHESAGLTLSLSLQP